MGELHMVEGEAPGVEGLGGCCKGMVLDPLEREPRIP